ncbi:MAG TPA: BatA domain-containing protein, partial [Bacteroidia bacterium]|nr:BatA domain-containing protein [Bacteroidia bacterium]
MQFLNPQFLFAFFALAIPILVHLFNFRRYKKVLFTNVRFLQEIRQDTQNRSRLRNLLILASRLLAVTFLVLAFAQPYLPASTAAKRAAERRVAIWIDNSFSMEAQGSYGTLLDEARKKAREIALAFSPSDKFLLVTNDFEARHQHLVNRDEALQWIDAVQAGPAARSAGEVLLRARDGLKSGNLPASVSFDAYLLSDFQRRIADMASAPADSSVKVHLLALKANATANVFIDTCYLESPVVQLGSPNELIVSLRNSGEKPVENIPVRLTINGYQKALASVPLEAGAQQEVRLAFTIQNPGWQEAIVSLTDYPVTFDDTFHFTFRVRTDVPIVAINGSAGASPYLD